MPELKTKILELVEGVPYVPNAGDAVIPSQCSIRDILRYLHKQCGDDNALRQEVEYYLEKPEL